MMSASQSLNEVSKRLNGIWRCDSTSSKPCPIRLPEGKARQWGFLRDRLMRRPPGDFLRRQRRSWVESLPYARVARQWGIRVVALRRATGSGIRDGRHVAGLAFPCCDREGSKYRIVLYRQNLLMWTHELSHIAEFRLNATMQDKAANEFVAVMSGAALLVMAGRCVKADMLDCMYWLDVNARKMIENDRLARYFYVFDEMRPRALRVIESVREAA